VSYKYKISSFSLGLREQVQYGFNDLNTIDYYFENKLMSRTRVSAKYAIFGTPLAVHSSYEFFLNLNSLFGVMPSAHRIKAGVEYSFSGKSELDISYMLEEEFNTANPVRSHILALTFGYKF
jgi:hypothetical protein